MIEDGAGRRAGRPQPLATGTQTTSTTWHQQPMPPFALDAAHNRFAIADNDTASVAELTSTSGPPDDLHLATTAGHSRSQDAVRRGRPGVPYPPFGVAWIRLMNSN